MDSIYDKPTRLAEDTGVRSVVGLPLIVGSVAADAFTWPFQLIFGVWPMWGRASQHMKPSASL